MQQAKVLSDQHASNPNSEILSQVALSIQEAVLASREISSLKTELKIDKIKID